MFHPGPLTPKHALHPPTLRVIGSQGSFSLKPETLNRGKVLYFKLQGTGYRLGAPKTLIRV